MRKHKVFAVSGCLSVGWKTEHNLRPFWTSAVCKVHPLVESGLEMTTAGPAVVVIKLNVKIIE